MRLRECIYRFPMSNFPSAFGGCFTMSSFCWFRWATTSDIIHNLSAKHTFRFPRSITLATTNRTLHNIKHAQHNVTYANGFYFHSKWTYPWPRWNFPFWLNTLSSAHFCFWHKRWLLHKLTIRRIDLLAFATRLFFIAITWIHTRTNTLTWTCTDATIHRTLEH